jgi:hypothetical protein
MTPTSGIDIAASEACFAVESSPLRRVIVVVLNSCLAIGRAKNGTNRIVDKPACKQEKQDANHRRITQVSSDDT